MGETDKFLTDIVNEGTYTNCAKQAHETWKTTKESQGWVYGEKRDNEAKTNPLMVEYDELSVNIQGQNSLTPYAVVNYLRINEGEKTLAELEMILEGIIDRSDEKGIDQMSEYVHSHFIAAELAKGQTTKTRNDMIVYEGLDADTKSWDTESAIGVVKYLKEQISTTK